MQVRGRLPLQSVRLQALQLLNSFNARRRSRAVAR
jgi:hypothetical protein